MAACYVGLASAPELLCSLCRAAAPIFALCGSRNLHLCPCRFLNHSCSPNVGSQMVLQQEGSAAVLFYALHDIQRGEALSISVRASSSALTILRGYILLLFLSSPTFFTRGRCPPLNRQACLI